MVCWLATLGGWRLAWFAFRPPLWGSVLAGELVCLSLDRFHQRGFFPANGGEGLGRPSWMSGRWSIPPPLVFGAGGPVVPFTCYCFHQCLLLVPCPLCGRLAFSCCTCGGCLSLVYCPWAFTECKGFAGIFSFFWLRTSCTYWCRCAVGRGAGMVTVDVQRLVLDAPA